MVVIITLVLVLLPVQRRHCYCTSVALVQHSRTNGQNKFGGPDNILPKGGQWLCTTKHINK